MNNEQSLHHLIALTKELAEELQRNPTKGEIIQRAKISRFHFDTLTGGLKPFLDMCGLKFIPSNKKITNDIFKVNIERHVQEYVPRDWKSPIITSDFLIAGDTHFPFIHKPTIDAFHEFNREYQPKYVIQVGDLYDMYAHSRFARSHNVYTPKEEEALGRKLAEEFFKQIRKDNPKAIIYNIKGNHDIRPIKRTIEQAPNLEHWVEKYLNDLMTFEGVNLVSDHREVLKIEGIGFHHGYKSSLGEHRDNFLMNMVVGHTHKGGTMFRKIRDQILWELNAGLMGDPESKVMDYTPTKDENNTLGFGYIDKYGPRFIAR